MKRILVGVDGSKEARDAVKLAEEIARATECQLIVACAVSPVDPIQTAPELLAQAARTAAAAARRTIEAVFFIGLRG